MSNVKKFREDKRIIFFVRKHNRAVKELKSLFKINESNRFLNMGVMLDGM